MSNFTELEDALMDCWGVTNDLKACAEHCKDENMTDILNAYALVYDFKMERMFDIFELCIKDYYELKNKSPLSDTTIEVIAEKYADLGGDIPCDKWVPFARDVLRKKEDTPW